MLFLYQVRLHIMSTFLCRVIYAQVNSNEACRPTHTVKIDQERTMRHEFQAKTAIKIQKKMKVNTPACSWDAHRAGSHGP